MRIEASISQLLLNTRIRNKVKPHLESWMFQTECYKALAMTLISKNFEGRDADPKVIMMTIESDYPNLSEGDYKEIERLIRTCPEIHEEDEKHTLSIIESFLKKMFQWKGGDILSSTGDATQSEPYYLKSLNLSLSENEPVNLANKEVIKQQIKECLPEDGRYMKSSYGLINEHCTYKGYRRGDLALWVAPPGRGKTTALAQEAACLSDQGFKVGYAVIGDNTEMDIAVKICSFLSGTVVGEVVEDIEMFIDSNHDTLSNIMSIAYPPCVHSASEILADFKKIKQKSGLDVLIIDYDANIASKSVEHGMYLSGGEVYAALKAFAQTEKCAVIVASQPKTEYYGREILDLQSANESSRKQHYVDMMVCFNSNPDCKDVGTMHLAKVRRGMTGMMCKVHFNYTVSELREISEDEYNSILSRSKNGNPDDTEIKELLKDM